MTSSKDDDFQTDLPASPGRPGSQAPSFDEPEQPTAPSPPKPSQQGAEPVTPTGATPSASETSVGQQGSYLTTSQGVRLRDTDHSLKAGERGPILLQDHHLRDKVTHFDHERIPERVVHARGAAAHGYFEGYGTASSLTKAGFLAKGKVTPVFTRFSTVLGSRGSADTVRDTRGFATKFYTDEGTFDLAGNNIPVFFIQDGIKFPDVIHAGKPHPDREIPQAQSAHDTFWDFVSLHTEAQHHTLWNMSDRGIPRSFRMMEGFGIHTFRFINEDEETTLVKFHWKPKLGVHSLVWEEAQLLAGIDPDFHRRDLADAIEAGAYPEWELGVQTFPDTPEQTFEGIDLLDPTKIVPEELAPVQLIGRLVLNKNPLNYFAETEQVAFHPGNLPPGIDVTDDPLLQVRLFSYQDTQLTRLGGPNYGQLPINRPHAGVNDMLRDGYGQQADHSGVAPYRPNSLDGGCPFTAGDPEHAFTDIPVQVPAAPKNRKLASSFDDHFSQPRLFWRSMSPIEQDHIIAAYSFELSKCYEPAVRARQLQCLANIDESLCRQVAASLGLPAPDPTEEPHPDDEPEAGRLVSPALSQVGRRWPVDGRLIGVVVSDSPEDPAPIAALTSAIADSGMLPILIGPHAGTLNGLPIQRTFATARSAELDALLIADDPEPAADSLGAQDTKAATRKLVSTDPRVSLLISECWRQAKPIGAWGAATGLLTGLGIQTTKGVIAGHNPQAVLKTVQGLLETHRVWDRFASTDGNSHKAEQS
ncbi:catalase [Propionimicrobium sp. PCR01-08-3]|uniref:catalase n=1 Tax=Propionimicrobium sp. PCR01-08-3 TaxID=3052086 RepID=UPI00255CF404|nr:catalase [Propionimicrobium sp. PCR01-08-3]WIY82436.1 catalase [Propionimicrobium sp. PCR01-08-3]